MTCDRRTTIMMGLVVMMTFMTGSASGQRYRLYVSHGGNKISSFEMDPGSGNLTLDSTIEVGPKPGAMAVDPSKKFLYVSTRSDTSISALAIGPATGRLAPINRIETIGAPTYLAVDHTGKFLLSAYYGDDEIAVHRFGANGAIVSEAVLTQTTNVHPHCILMDRSGRFVYVPNTGSHLILQFAFDARTGILTPNSVPQVETEPETGPRHITFHPSKNFAYVVNEKGDSVTAFETSESTGVLRSFQTLSTLPAGFDGSRNSCADIEVTPSGKFLYASNRGHDSIAGFSIAASTGRLTSLGQTATEKTPRSFNIDPTGKFLYAAGQRSGQLAAYRIDSVTGALSRFATYPVPEGPSWIQVVQLPR